MLYLNSWKINLSAKQKSQSSNSKSQIPKHKRWLYSVWYLEFGAWDFYVFSFKRREECPTKAFTEAEDASPKQLENQPKCEAEKPKLKFQIPKHKRWLYSVWYLEFGAWDFYVFFF
jgi:hypothetical protein